MRTITDTQVLSYYFKGVMPAPLETVQISSITAAEFLLVQSKEHNKANYYPILPSLLQHKPPGIRWFDSSRIEFDSRRHAELGKGRTDQLILDFGRGVPIYVEFGSIALTQLINGQHEQLYASGISHLVKDRQKTLRKRFRFLLENDVFCVAATIDTAKVGLNLLGEFMDRYQAKRNTRNTINDVLILATAIQQSLVLRTEDSLLRRFVAEIAGATCTSQGGQLLLDFSTHAAQDRRSSLEAKGYVNRGWQVLERRSR